MASYIGFIWLLWISICIQHEGDRIANHYTDSRDGQVYATVVIGDRIWFSENLKYKTPNSVCYDHQEAHCDKYGRLYPIDEAWIACPEKWRLPDSNDVAALHAVMKTRKIAKIAMPGEWRVKAASKFNNTLGLSILPAGRIDSFSFFSEQQDRWIDTVAFHQLETAASFWLESEINDQGILHWHLGSPIGEVKSGLHRHDISPVLHKFSIRCVCELRPDGVGSNIEPSELSMEQFADNLSLNREVVKRADLSGMWFYRGKCVIEICVDRNGRVISAHYDLDNSTIKNRAAIAKAEECARQYFFNTDASAPIKECGILTFIFERN